MNTVQKQASLRRRRARDLSQTKTDTTASKPASRRSRRRYLSSGKYSARVRREWDFQAEPGFMGHVFDQPLYSCRCQPGAAFDLPFDERQPFACLINAAVHIPDSAFVNLARRLLERNMRFAVCAGIESDRLADLLNDVLEEGEYHDEGRTAVAASYEDEPVEEAMEYFILPSGIAPASLVVTIGDEPVFRATLNVLDRVVRRMQSELA